MDTFFLTLLDYHQPRRIRVIENLLKNRRTVANLFWGQQYGILNWLGAYRELNRSEYEAALQDLAAAGLIKLDDNFAQLTAAGVAQREVDQVYQPHFFSWYWVTNTRQLETQLMLGIQVISELAYHNNQYAPLAVSHQQLMGVKQWLYREYSPQLIHDIYDDLHQLMTALASEDQRLATALAYLMIGHHQSSWTLKQLATNLALSLGDARILKHDLMLAVGAYYRHVTGPVHDLLRPYLMHGPLPASVLTTLRMFQRVPDFTEIARQRHLKVNTIREHILEVAILMPDQLNFDQLLPPAKRVQLARTYSGNDVTKWEFQKDTANSSAGFFDFRLFQIYQGAINNDN